MSTLNVYPQFKGSFSIYLRKKEHVFEKELDEYMRRFETFCNPNSRIEISIGYSGSKNVKFTFQNIKEFKNEKELYYKEIEVLKTVFCNNPNCYYIEIKI